MKRKITISQPNLAAIIQHRPIENHGKQLDIKIQRQSYDNSASFRSLCLVNETAGGKQYQKCNSNS